MPYRFIISTSYWLGAIIVYEVAWSKLTCLYPTDDLWLVYQHIESWALTPFVHSVLYMYIHGQNRFTDRHPVSQCGFRFWKFITNHFRKRQIIFASLMWGWPALPSPSLTVESKFESGISNSNSKYQNLQQLCWTLYCCTWCIALIWARYVMWKYFSLVINLSLFKLDHKSTFCVLYTTLQFLCNGDMFL